MPDGLQYNISFFKAFYRRSKRPIETKIQSGRMSWNARLCHYITTTHVYFTRKAIHTTLYTRVFPRKTPVIRSPLFLRTYAKNMKRKASPSRVKSPPKKAKADIPEYHLSPSVREEDGSIQWPAPRAQIEKARQMILDWSVDTRLLFTYEANCYAALKANLRLSSSRTKTLMGSQPERFCAIP